MPNYGKPFAGLCLATAIFLCGVTGYPVAPDALPSASGTLDLGSASSESEVATGSTATVLGHGFADGAAVTISVYGEPQLLAEVVASQAGSIETEVELPAGLAPGLHTIVALGNAPDGSTTSLQTQVTVVRAPALPLTGAALGAVFLVGIGLLIGGFALLRTVVFGRRFLYG